MAPEEKKVDGGTGRRHVEFKKLIYEVAKEMNLN